MRISSVLMAVLAAAFLGDLGEVVGSPLNHEVPLNLAAAEDRLTTAKDLAATEDRLTTAEDRLTTAKDLATAEDRYDVCGFWTSQFDNCMAWCQGSYTRSQCLNNNCRSIYNTKNNKCG